MKNAQPVLTSMIVWLTTALLLHFGSSRAINGWWAMELGALLALIVYGGLGKEEEEEEEEEE